MDNNEELVDITGKAIFVGNYVVYPQMSGRSVQMVLGRVVSLGETAQVQRIVGARWTASHETTCYRDKRTGKGINIWSESMKHWEVQPKTVYVHRGTGEESTPQEWYYSERYRNFQEWEQKYIRGTLKDYVEEYTPESKPVTIRNIKNLVRVDYDPETP